MQIENWDISRLREYENNPRKNDHAVEAVATAIDAYGFNVPIMVKADGEIIDGHLRYKAAMHLGLDEVPVVVADHLSEDQIKAFRISVNKVAELAKWDMKLLELEMQSLADLDYDLESIGFSETELDIMLGDQKEKTEKDNVPDLKEPVARLGDLFTLGGHRLFVGDSTKRESYEALLGDDKADIVWTDPPYNVDYSSKAGKIKNDKMSEKQFNEFLLSFYTQAYNAVKEGGPIYVAHADGQPSSAFRGQFLAAGFYHSTCLIWKKHQSTIGRSDYHYQHEPILYGWKPGAPHCWYGERKRKSIMEFGAPPIFSPVDGGGYEVQIGNEILHITGSEIKVESLMSTVMMFDKPAKSELHPTMKPVALVEHCLMNSSRKNDIVLDPFGGSGTTLIACESKWRRARLIELDEKFADVIIRRWQEYTGKQAYLSTGEAYDELKEKR